MPGPLTFVLYVFKGDLLLELPSYDHGTLNDPRLQMQQALCEEIRQHLDSFRLDGKIIQMGGEFTELRIKKRMTHVFKIEIAPGKVRGALNIIEKYLASKSISVDIKRLGVVPAPNRGEKTALRLFM